MHAAELARIGGEMAQAGGLAGPSLMALGRVVEQLEERQRQARRQFASAFASYDRTGTRRLLDRASGR